MCVSFSMLHILQTILHVTSEQVYKVGTKRTKGENITQSRGEFER